MLYLCIAVPVIPLPDIVLVKNPGFYFTTMSEFDIITTAFTAHPTESPNMVMIG